MLSLPFFGQAQFDTLYMDLQPSANEVLPTLMIHCNEYWSFGKTFIGQDDHFRIKKVNGQGEVLEVLDSTAYAPYIYISMEEELLQHQMKDSCWHRLLMGIIFPL